MNEEPIVSMLKRWAVGKSFAFPSDAEDAYVVSGTPWLRYQNGESNPQGWLFSHSSVYQYNGHMRDFLFMNYLEDVFSQQDVPAYYACGLDLDAVHILTGCIGVAQYHHADEMFVLRQNQVVQAALLATVIVLILVVTNSGTGQPFVYQGFSSFSNPDEFLLQTHFIE